MCVYMSAVVRWIVRAYRALAAFQPRSWLSAGVLLCTISFISCSFLLISCLPFCYFFFVSSFFVFLESKASVLSIAQPRPYIDAYFVLIEEGVLKSPGKEAPKRGVPGKPPLCGRLTDGRRLEVGLGKGRFELWLTKGRSAVLTLC